MNNFKESIIFKLCLGSLILIGCVGNALKFDSIKKQNGVHVVVIGGGVAGVTAAANLHKAGFNVTLLEAMDRVGGRTWTFKMENGQQTELGGEWVHGQINNSVYDLMNPLGVLQPRKHREFGNTFGLATGDLINASMTPLLPKFKEYVWTDPEMWWPELNVTLTSKGEWAKFVIEKFNEEFNMNDDPIILSSIYDWAHRVTNAEDATNNWFESSETKLGDQEIVLDGFGNVPWKPPYSYHTLVQYILTDAINEDGVYDLPEYIHLNKEVVNIDYHELGDWVTVTTLDRVQYRADHVIFTPSLGVLKANHFTLFTPPLSSKKRLAIEYIGFGCATKYAMEFETPWWPPEYQGLFPLWNDHNYSNISLEYWRDGLTKEDLEVETDGIPLWGRAILNFFTVDSGSAPNVLRAWVTGWPSRFMDEMEPSYIQSVVMKVMHKFLDKTFPNITEPIKTYQSKWWSNPHVRGVYSFRSVETELMDVWARDLAEPIVRADISKPLIGFAGEATHPFYFSTAHGAYDTGIREFKRIQSYYENK